MFSFSFNIFKLLRAIRHGIKEDVEFRTLLVSLLFLLISGTYFYWQIEGWSVVDAAYFCVMTMSTIGYGDFVPTTTYSKIFTMVYALLSIGVFVAVVTKLVMVILSQKKATYDRMRHNPDAAESDDH